jgi:hypothetical protein
VKAILALAVFAALGFAAGCGAAKKIVVNMDTDSLTTRIANGYAGTLPGIRLDHRIGLVSFREPKPQIVKALGGGVAAHLPNGQTWRFYPKAGLYVAYPRAARGEQTYAAFIITMSARYKTQSGVGVGSTLRQLRQHIDVRCYLARAVPGQCQHERADKNLPFTVFSISAKRRVIEIAVVPGGD